MRVMAQDAVVDRARRLMGEGCNDNLLASGRIGKNGVGKLECERCGRLQ